MLVEKLGIFNNGDEKGRVSSKSKEVRVNVRPICGLFWPYVIRHYINDDDDLKIRPYFFLRSHFRSTVIQLLLNHD